MLRGLKPATVSRCSLMSTEGDNNFHQSTGSALLRGAQDAVAPFCCQGTALADVCCLPDPCIPFQHSCSPQSAPGLYLLLSLLQDFTFVPTEFPKVPVGPFLQSAQALLNGNLAPRSPSLMSSVNLMNVRSVASRRSLMLNRACPSTDPVLFHLPQASRLSMTH